jgi:transcriptional regulator of NAD metabolism
MVDKTSSGYFEATLLEFGLVSWAETQEEVIKRLTKLTHFHILSVMEKNDFDQFIHTVDENAMDNYWRNYRRIEFSLAKTGKDLSHDMDSRLIHAVKSMLTEETNKMIEALAKNNAEEIVAEVKRMMTLSSASLTYAEIGMAA